MVSRSISWQTKRITGIRIQNQREYDSTWNVRFSLGKILIPLRLHYAPKTLTQGYWKGLQQDYDNSIRGTRGYEYRYLYDLGTIFQQLRNDRKCDHSGYCSNRTN